MPHRTTQDFRSADFINGTRIQYSSPLSEEFAEWKYAFCVMRHSGHYVVDGLVFSAPLSRFISFSTSKTCLSVAPSARIDSASRCK